MDDEFLQYYNDELRDLRQQGKKFAAAYPHLAAHCRLDTNSQTDPLTTHLTESFAFLTAKIRQQIETQAASTSNSLLNILYPQYLRPVPAMSVAQFTPNQYLDRVQTIPAQTELYMQSSQGIPCRLRTTYTTSLAPLKITQIKIDNVNHKQSPHCKACLTITLECLHPELNIATIDLKDLRFFIDIESDF